MDVPGTTGLQPLFHPMMHDIFQCGLCSVTFDLNPDLVSHVERHALPKPFQCGICKSSYNTNPELALHFRVHNIVVIVPVPAGHGLAETDWKQNVLGSNSKKIRQLASSAKGDETKSCEKRQHNKRRASSNNKRGSISQVTVKLEAKGCVKSAGDNSNDHDVHFGDESDDSSEVDDNDSDDDYVPSGNMTYNSSSGRKRRKRAKMENTGNATAEEDSELQAAGSEERESEVEKSVPIVQQKYSKHQSGKLEFYRKQQKKLRMTKAGKVKHLECKDCGKFFSRADVLRAHRNTHLATKPYECAKCQSEYSSLSAYKYHMRQSECSKSVGPRDSSKYVTVVGGVKYEVDIGDNVFPKKCTDCDFILKNRGTLKRHMKEIHWEIRSHVCEVCNRGFKRQNELRQHRHTHSDKPFMSCEKCGQGFNSRQAYKFHVEHQTCIKKLIRSEKDSPFMTVEGTFPGRCKECDKVFASKNTLKKHTMEVHWKLRPHVCEYCAKAFSRLTDLESHRNLHQNMKPYSCASCGSQFSSRRALYTHTHRNMCLLSVAAKAEHQTPEFTTLEGSFPGTCRLCSRMLKNRATLIKHVKEVHMKIQRYKCDVCEKTFCRYTELRAHRNTHLDVKPFTCDLCQAGYNSQSALNIHYQNSHGDKSFPCTLCNRNFSSADILSRHMERHADGKETYPCLDCDRGFMTLKSLKRHRKSKHHSEESSVSENNPMQPGTNFSSRVNITGLRNKLLPGSIAGQFSLNAHGQEVKNEPMEMRESNLSPGNVRAEQGHPALSNAANYVP